MRSTITRTFAVSTFAAVLMLAGVGTAAAAEPDPFRPGPDYTNFAPGPDYTNFQPGPDYTPFQPGYAPGTADILDDGVASLLSRLFG